MPTTLDTTPATSDSKLYKFANNGVEKASFDNDGGLTISGVVSGANAITIPDGSRINFGVGGAYLYRHPGQGVATDGGVRAAGGYVGPNLYAPGTSPLSLKGATPDGPAAANVIMETGGPYTTAGARLLSIRNGGVEKAAIDKDGKRIHQSASTTGTPGDTTANAPTGMSAIAKDASSVTITNSCVTANSLVRAWIQQAQADATLLQVIRTSAAPGAFTVYGNAPASNPVVIGWEVIN